MGVSGGRCGGDGGGGGGAGSPARPTAPDSRPSGPPAAEAAGVGSTALVVPSPIAIRGAARRVAPPRGASGRAPALGLQPPVTWLPRENQVPPRVTPPATASGESCHASHTVAQRTNLDLPARRATFGPDRAVHRRRQPERGRGPFQTRLDARRLPDQPPEIGRPRLP